jgi:glycosyltransferase involved in cell wall biosynthesis
MMMEGAAPDCRRERPAPDAQQVTMSVFPDETDLPIFDADAPGGGVMPHRLRIAWIAGRQTLEELSRVLQPLAIGLLDELVEVVAVCPQRPEMVELPSPPLEILRYEPSHMWPMHPGTIRSLAGELQARKVDMLHALDATAADLTRRHARAAGLRYVVSSYSLDDMRYLGTVDQSAAAVLAASDAVRQNLLNRNVAPADKVHVLRPGVYQVRHASCFDEPEYSVAILAGGPLDDYDSFAAVVRSFAELRERKYDCAFFLMGNGPVEKPLRRLVEDVGLRRELTFVDHQAPAQLPGIFAAADLYVSPTRSRAVDVQTLLAMAAGVPVLTACDGADDFLLDNKTALCFRPGVAVDLTAKLTRLLDDRAGARALAENALGYLRERHSPAGMVASLAGLYRQCARPAVVAATA